MLEDPGDDQRVLDAGHHPHLAPAALAGLREGDNAAASAILSAFVAVNPDDAEASAALVRSLLAQQELAAAEAEAKRGMERGAGSVLAEQQLAQILQAKGSDTEALARYRAVLAKDPQQLQALEGLTNILLDAGRGAEAIDFLKSYPEDNLDASLLLGRAYVRQGDVKAARAVHERAIRLMPTDPRAHLALAALAPTDSPEQLAALRDPIPPDRPILRNSSRRWRQPRCTGRSAGYSGDVRGLRGLGAGDRERRGSAGHRQDPRAPGPAGGAAGSAARGAGSATGRAGVRLVQAVSDVCRYPSGGAGLRPGSRARRESGGAGEIQPLVSGIAGLG
ncbi:MAG: tetratricopeptide repeat protein [Chromatiales bacterium]|nr:tetratricopeptide repeat protein [Chromatiales bacterium]